MDNLYQILGLEKNCSAEEIKQKFRILARLHHPDMGGDEEIFKKINFAYEVLGDPVRREDYDKTGNTRKPLDIDHEARVNLSNLFFAILPNFDPNTGNILEIIKHEITRSMDAISKDIDNCNLYITKLELTKGKIRTKTDMSENMFFSFIDSQIETKQNDLKIFDRRIQIAHEMLLILENYLYGFIELPNTPSEGGGFKHDGGG